MRKWAIVLVCFLLLPLVVRGGVAQTLRFSVNGQAVKNQVYTLSHDELGAGALFYLSLPSDVYLPKPLEFTLEVDPPGMRREGVAWLSFSNYRVAADQGVLALSSFHVQQLFSDSRRLLLTLGSEPLAPGTVFTVTARQYTHSRPLAQVKLQVGGLRTPNERTGWPQLIYSNRIPVSVYPNTIAQGVINIDLRGVGGEGDGWVNIVDLLGLTVLSNAIMPGHINQVSIDRLPSGVYFVQVEVNSHVLYTERLVVDH